MRGDRNKQKMLKTDDQPGLSSLPSRARTPEKLPDIRRRTQRQRRPPTED